MGSMERVTRAKPCAVCQHHDWCVRLRKWHWCMRLESTLPHPKGGWLHTREDVRHIEAPVELPAREPHVSDEALHAIWGPIAGAAAMTRELPKLAASLGTATEALRDIHAGFGLVQGAMCWTFPERNQDGLIIGVVRRMPDGTKRCARGSRRGLTYCDAWASYAGVVWVVEGASDVAAGLTLGLCVVGRPSNTGGVSALAGLLRKHPNRQVVVLGERDKKQPLYVHQTNPKHNPQCRGCMLCWPGLVGAIATAKVLSRRLGRPVGWRLPPPGIKDLREYLIGAGLNPEHKAQCYHYGRALQKGRFPTANTQSH